MPRDYQPHKRLFWFLREGARIDLDDPPQADLLVQQVLTRGRLGDVRDLLKTLPWNRLRESIRRVNPFLPTEVRMFWEDFLAGHQ
ncbi:MAG: hypothetical protein HY211_03310 [Candidatus Omnitrophica bacterium]|nr:hypothetical protein [Candidatus Omnitrophota bacterium]